MPDKKTRLAKRAAKAHERAVKRGDTQVGTRKSPSSPRTLSSGTIPVYRREQKLLEKISNITTKPPKGPKQTLIGRVKEVMKSGRGTKRGRTKAQRVAGRNKKCRGRARNRRKHDSCKA